MCLQNCLQLFNMFQKFFKLIPHVPLFWVKTSGPATEVFRKGSYDQIDVCRLRFSWSQAVPGADATGVPLCVASSVGEKNPSNFM